MPAAPATRPSVPWSGPPLAAAVGLAALTVVTGAYAYGASAPAQAGESALLRALVVGVPAAVGLAVLRRRPGDRFARLLIATVPLLALATLAVATHGLPYSVGRVAVWVAEPTLVYVLLAFPAGRPATPAQRRVAIAAGALAGGLYVATVPFIEHFPEPSPWGTCGTDCPRNAFMLTSAEPAVLEGLIRPLREALTVVLYVAVCVLIARRMRQSLPLGRWALAPVLATAALRLVALGGYDAARAGGHVNGFVDAIGDVYQLTPAFIAIGFAAGLLAARVYVATALERLTRRARSDLRASELARELADALEDPAIRIAYRASEDADLWADETGSPVAPLRPTATRAVTELVASGRTVAIEHDPALLLEPGIVAGAASYALAMIENDRLVAEREERVRELSASRARIVGVADETRRRIERDLHDGAQQRLVVVRAALALEGERIGGSSPDLAAVLERLGDDVEATIDEVRAIARGLYPSLLAERGLAEALRAAARAAPLPVQVVAEGLGRYAPEVEATVYFACVEALQNAIKHAGASGLWISVSGDRHLRFDVRDDGSGFVPGGPPRGSGLTNLRDRIAAVGGVLTVDSSPGRGTRVAGVVPVEPPAPAGGFEANGRP